MRTLGHVSLFLIVALSAFSSLGATCDPGGGQPDGGPVDAPVIDASAPDASAPPDAAPADVPGCDGARLLPTPVDPSARGPWPVGARTVHLGDLTAEVWYPAVPGSERGVPPLVYDLRTALPPTEMAKIPDADNPWQTCDCERDLPLDVGHGPYPGVLFIHGTASFRHQSLSQVTHWASRGFVVLSVDHPGLRLGHMLAQLCPGNPKGTQDLDRDIDAELAALSAPSGELAFLAGHVDGTRLAVTGHSAGAEAAAGTTGKPGVRLVISLAGNVSAPPAPALQGALYMGGLVDTVVKWDEVTTAYAGAATPRYLVGLGNAGHLAFSDLCDTRNAQGQNLIQIAREHHICGAALAGLLFDCKPSYLPGPVGWSIIDDATSIALESTLQCRGDLPALSSIGQRHPDVAHYEQSP